MPETICIAPFDYFIEGREEESRKERERRFETALEIARAEEGMGNAVTIYCGGGTPWKKDRDRLQPLATTMAHWFVKHGWPHEQLITNGKGFDTITEAAAINEMLPEGARVIAVSSWYQVLRIWLIWIIAFRRCVRISKSKSTLPSHQAVWREIKVTIPSLGLAFIWGIGGEKFVRRLIESRFRPQ